VVFKHVLKTCYETGSSGLVAKGVARVVDCVLEGVVVSSIPEIRELAVKVVGAVFKNLSGELVFNSSESIGSTHTLHRFKLMISGGKYIGVRVVVRGREAIRALFTVPSGINVKYSIEVSRYSPDQDLARSVEKLYAKQPPGQVFIDIPIVYAILGVPRINIISWRLFVGGLVENPVDLDLPSLYELGVETILAGFHCVTGWSVKALEFAGISTERIAELVKPSQEAKWVFVESLDGYTTIIPIEEFLRRGSMVALEMNGKPLDILHGYPARLVVPHLYGWKSAKWLKSIVFTDRYSDGYWEALGYHPRGRVDLEERFKEH